MCAFVDELQIHAKSVYAEFCISAILTPLLRLNNNSVMAGQAACNGNRTKTQSWSPSPAASRNRAWIPLVRYNQLRGRLYLLEEPNSAPRSRKSGASTPSDMDVSVDSVLEYVAGMTTTSILTAVVAILITLNWARKTLFRSRHVRWACIWRRHGLFVGSLRDVSLHAHPRHGDAGTANRSFSSSMVWEHRCLWRAPNRLSFGELQKGSHPNLFCVCRLSHVTTS